MITKSDIPVTFRELPIGSPLINSLHRVKSSIDKITALQLALSTKQREYLKKPIYSFMSQLTYKNKERK